MRALAWWLRGGLLLLALLMVGACSVNTTVSATGSTPSQVQHLYLTVTQVWLNSSATAAPTDSGWVGEKLSQPQTFDLATLGAGTLATLVSGVKTPPGIYRQVQLVLADSADALTSSASSAGLTWNAQVQYLDAAGSSLTLPLELPARAAPVVVPVAISISAGGVLPMMTGATTSTTDSSTGDSTSVSTVATTTDGTTAVISVAVDVDAVRNFLLFDYGNAVGAMLSVAPAACDLAKAGAISGTLDLSAVPGDVPTGAQGIVVTAERLSADGSRYEAVKSVAVSSGGAFTLYPLPLADTGSTSYEVVIHGPAIRTVIISQVPVVKGAAADATLLQSSALKLIAARSFLIDTAANSARLPAGAHVGLYQTVPGFNVPHLVEYQGLDPFNGGLAARLSLSADALDHGAWSSGADISFSTVAPDEGAGTYRIGASAPLWAPSTLSGTLSAPGDSTTAVQPLFLPVLGTAQGGALGLDGTLDLGSAGRFDRGFVLVSRGGQLVEAVDLTAALAGLSASPRFTVPVLPAGVTGTRYDVSVRLWNSLDPAGSLARASASAPVDASRGAQSITISVR
ncbi:MAG: DUF4382 domain-containing protein [Steroidobacteraceae bacterium]